MRESRDLEWLVPLSASQAFLSDLPPYARSMRDLVVPQHLLEGAVPTQDSQQLLLYIQQKLLVSDGPLHVILAAAGGIGYYVLQLRAMGFLTSPIKFDHYVTQNFERRMQESGRFPDIVDDLVAIFQEKKEAGLLAQKIIAPDDHKISITAIITHYNRPQFLRQSLNSLLQQSYLPQEIIIVDDGSDKSDAVSELSAIESEKHKTTIRILRLSHGLPAAARNAGWRSAKTEFIFFMDDDNVAMADELEKLAQAALISEADIVTCQMSYFENEGECDDVMQARRWLPIGSALDVGLYANLFGDTNALYRRSILEMQNGFTTDIATGHEDWEFFAKACLAGARLELLPLSLYWYRRRPADSFQYSTNAYKNLNRSLRPYLETLPDYLRNILRMALGMHLHNETGPSYNVGLIWKDRDK